MQIGLGRPLVLLLAGLTLTPLLIVLSSFLDPQPEIWVHLSRYVLPDLLLNTAWLLLGVLVGVLLLGVSLAWLTAVYAFPGRHFFAWALLLPLAMPAYVLAFAQIGLLDYTGPVQSWLREWLGGSHAFPRIRSRGGVIVVLSLALYPYVYLLARNAFLTQGRRALEVAQSLGLSPWQGFWQVALPLARPWIVGGAMLALMECLADFGTVSIFNYDTFTTAIYKSWFALFNLPAAAQLASLLMLFVLLLAWLEGRERGDRRYHADSKAAPAVPLPLSGWRRYAASAFPCLVLLLAFGVPLVQLGYWAAGVWHDDLDSRYWQFVGSSLLLASLAAVLIAFAALTLSFVTRRYPQAWLRWAARLSTLGYAVPGTVLAVGIFIPIAWLDNQLLSLLEGLGYRPSTVLKGTVLVMLLAYLARFQAVAYQPIAAAMQRITHSQEEAAQTLGCSRRGLLWRVHLPQLRSGMLVAILLVFVDVMKEMPITLMTRPFGWDTLAVRVFELTSEGEWQRAALPSLAIVLAGLLPVLLLSRHSERRAS